MTEVLSAPARVQEAKVSTARRAPVTILGAGLSGLAAAIVLAREGVAVDVHDARGDSGERFGFDFQAIENWTANTDFMAEMRAWGLDTDGFAATEVRQIDLITPSGKLEQARSSRVACRLVQRGVHAPSLDQALKRQALRDGVRLHYNSRLPADRCDIIATGPRAVTGAVRGELFHTDYPDKIALQFNARLSPGAYSYLVVQRGVGLIANVMMDASMPMDALLDQTIQRYRRYYPSMDYTPVERRTGVGGFSLRRRYTAERRYFVGEAAGLQDCFWGFGIRYAITSGRLAALAILHGNDYDREVRRHFAALQRASLANRWLLDASGPRGLSIMSRLWMAHQRLTGDGLRFIEAIYRPSILHDLLFHLVGRRLLVRPRGDGRQIAVLPFKKS